MSRELESALESLQRENEALKRRLAKLQRNTERQERFQQQNSSLLRGAMDDLDVEKAKSERLLLNILPAQIVERLNRGEEEIVIHFHVETIGCRICRANLDDLRARQKEASHKVNTRRQKYFQSSAGYLRQE